MRWERTVTVIGCHVGGEENDVIVGGVLPPPGATMFEKKRYLETARGRAQAMAPVRATGKADPLRQPRESVHPAGLRRGLHHHGISRTIRRCRSNTICTVTVLLETGMLPMREPLTTLTLDTPAGPVPVEASCRDGKVERVRFTNVPCFATHLGARLRSRAWARSPVDVAYGGAFFAIVDAPSLGFAVEPKEARDLVALGHRITAAAAQQLVVRHPDNPDIRDVTFTEFAMPFAGPGTVSRNAVIVAPGRIDRSPAAPAPRPGWPCCTRGGNIAAGQGFIHESIIGSRFEAGIASETTVEDGRASFPPSPAKRGSPACSSTASIRPIRFEAATPCPTCGSPDLSDTTTHAGRAQVARPAIATSWRPP